MPIHTEMVAPWKMRTPKRMAYTNRFGATDQNHRKKLNRLLDFMRFRYPLKLDFCRMTLDELTSMVNKVIEKDRLDPDSYKPLVAIGHSKDLTDFATIDAFLSFLREKKIEVCTFETIYPRLLQAKRQTTSIV